MSTTTHDPLTTRDVLRIAAVLDGADRGARVRWEGPADLDVREGIARRVSDFDGDTTHPDNVDVRDQWLHVSGVVETWLPMRDVLAWLADGCLHIAGAHQ